MIKKMNLLIWGRNIELPIDYNLYKGESITNKQTELLELFIKNTSWIEKSKSVVEGFCKEDVAEDDENQKKDNIFSYIKPDYIFIKNIDNPKLAIMCKYRYNPEHGIAVVFTKDGQITVGLQDIIL